jgi:trk system potassium uptake protein
MIQSKHIVIVGCGRLGSSLANQLSRQGHSIVVIDLHETAFAKLSSEFSGYKMIGDASEHHVLREAGLHKADCVFATTTEDNTNLMVAQVAKEVFSVTNVVARVYDPVRKSVYHTFGIETICPTQLSTDAFLEQVQ